jgi:hypothetical protein
MRFGGISSINYIEGWREEKRILVKNGFGWIYAQFFFLYKVLKRESLKTLRKICPRCAELVDYLRSGKSEVQK